MQTQEVHQVVGSASWHDAEDDDRIGLLDVEHQRGIQSVGGYEIRQYRVMKVSVVIPTHDRRAWLELTLRSVLRQHDVLEVIVVDDGSTDDTAETLAGLSDPRVRVVRHDTPRGVGASRNDGAARANGEWIAFVDDDDLWAPDKLARQLEAANATGRAWVYAGSVQIDEHSRIVGGQPAPPPEAVARLITRYNVIPGGCSNVIVRRDVFERAGPFDLRLKNTEDWEMWIRLNEHGPPAWVPRPLVGYRVHGGQASLDVAAILEGVSIIERRHGTRVDRGVIHRWMAEVCLRNGDRRRAVTHMVMAALHGQAVNVGGDAATIVRRRLHLDRASAEPQRRHREWIEEARAWVDELRAGDCTAAGHGDDPG
jgi:glycosyltransferase involved in cell wall biosynthesis